MCLRRRPVWPDPSGQGDRVAGVVRDMGGGRSGCTFSWESLAQNWGQRLFDKPGRRGPHFKHACIHPSIIHSQSVIQIHSFFIYSFIHCLLLGILCTPTLLPVQGMNQTLPCLLSRGPDAGVGEDRQENPLRGSWAIYSTHRVGSIALVSLAGQHVGAIGLCVGDVWA